MVVVSPGPLQQDSTMPTPQESAFAAWEQDLKARHDLFVDAKEYSPAHYSQTEHVEQLAKTLAFWVGETDRICGDATDSSKLSPEDSRKYIFCRKCHYGVTLQLNKVPLFRDAVAARYEAIMASQGTAMTA
jgi:hypothetical protein